MKDQANQAQDTVSREEGETDLLGILLVMGRHRKLLTYFPFAVAVIAAIISLMMPNQFKATAVLLPPQQSQSTATALLSQLSGLTGLAAGAAGLKNPNDMYMGVLQSRTVADRLIARFNLKKRYDVDSQEKARKILDKNTLVTSGKDGLISIEVLDNDQKLVPAIANAYVDELISLTNTLAVTEASRRRKFFEEQLVTAKNNLAKAESTLKGSLDTNGVVSVDVDSMAIVETIGRLRAQVSAKEIEINSMKPFLTESNPDFTRATEELRSLRSELSKLQNGRPDKDGQTNSSGKGGLENIKILRDVKYYQMLYELLAKQYEVARLDEAKDAGIIQVLDTAVEPEKKSKPLRAVIVILSAVVAFVVAVILSFLADGKRRMLEVPSNAERWAELMSYLPKRKRQ
jgi:tyrosine-protein kinase Etk/Wzc